MTSTTIQHEVPGVAQDRVKIHSVLAQLRARIRRYIWMEGIAVALIWLGITFWCALAIDYLPVLLGLSEMPWQARAVILVVIATVLGYILYRWILRRAFVTLSDNSMALLLERSFDQFQDGLVTSVEFTEKSKSIDDRMLDETTRAAVNEVEQVDLSKVFNHKPLAWSICGAVLLLFSVAVFGTYNSSAFALGGKRLYLLQEDPWPRRVHMEMVGIRIKRDEPIPGLPEIRDVIPFVDGMVRVSRGSNVELICNADGDVEENPNRKLPKRCILSYRTLEGERGSQEMNKVGRITDGFQEYVFDQHPLKGILSTLDINVRGDDHRISGYKIVVVADPIVIDAKIDCVFPEYMVDEQSLAWTDRTIQLVPGTELPIGTSATLQLVSNKSLSKAFVYNVKSKTTTEIDVANSDSNVSLPLGRLSEKVVLDITLLDNEGILSNAPFRVQIAAVKDKAPKIVSRLDGIGTAITPNARIPISGTITDDYEVARSWIEFRAPDEDTRQVPFQLQSDKFSAEIDFDKLAFDEDAPVRLEGGKQLKLSISVKAEDRYDLDQQQPNTGSGDLYLLEIVTKEEMARLLERLEVGQRRRLEQIEQEMEDTYAYLVRAKIGRKVDEESVEPGDSTEEPGDEASSLGDEKLEADELKLLYATRALLQTRKSRQEILGVAETFLSIRDQLVNNRLDREDKKSRLENDIAEPLRTTGEATMPALELQISTLEESLKTLARQYNTDAAQEVTELADTAIDQTVKTLDEIRAVLKLLVRYESHSEVLDVIRKMVKDQERILEETKKERKREQIGNLLD